MITPLDGAEHDRASRALLKAKKIEEQRIKDGWQYVQVASNLKILVPCDKNGKPTQEGLKKLAEYDNQDERYKKNAILFGILK